MKLETWVGGVVSRSPGPTLMRSRLPIVTKKYGTGLYILCYHWSDKQINYWKAHAKLGFVLWRGNSGNSIGLILILLRNLIGTWFNKKGLMPPPSAVVFIFDTCLFLNYQVYSLPLTTPGTINACLRACLPFITFSYNICFYHLILDSLSAYIFQGTLVLGDVHHWCPYVHLNPLVYHRSWTKQIFLIYLSSFWDRLCHKETKHHAFHFLNSR